MTVNADRLQEDIPWDLDRLPLPIGERVSEAALTVLEDAKPDQRPTVRRVLAEIRDEPGQPANAGDYLRAAKHADGRLVVVTWGSTGVTVIRWDADEDRYQATGYSVLDERVGRDPHFVEHSSRRQVETILGSAPQLVTPEETDLLSGGEGA